MIFIDFITDYIVYSICYTNELEIIQFFRRRNFMNKVISELSIANNFTADDKSSSTFGVKSGFPLIVTFEGNLYKIIFSLTNGTFPNITDLKRLVKESKNIANVAVRGYRVEFTVKSGLTTSATVEKINAAADDAVNFLYANGYASCCEKTGEVSQVEGYVVSGVPQLLSASSFAAISSELTFNEQNISMKKENLLGGIVGALLGSLIGVAAIVIIAQLGYVSVWSGVIMGVCTVKGYSILAGKFTKKGVIISLIVMAVMIYVGNNLDWAIAIMRELKFSFYDAFSSVGNIVKYSGLESNYIKNLVMLYAFSALGAIPTVIVSFKNMKNKNISYKI